MTVIGTVWLRGGVVQSVTAAVRQALENVGKHVGASRASVFAELIDGWITVSVRDDGHGFIYDEFADPEG